MAPVRRTRFDGWRVVSAAFVLAVFGWGMGFYGPPIFLEAVRATRGWPLAVVSAAGAVHFLVGGPLAANQPAPYRRISVPGGSMADALYLAIGVLGLAGAA